MLYVYKIIEKEGKKQTQRAWIFAAAFVGFLSSTLYLSVFVVQSAKVKSSVSVTLSRSHPLRPAR